MNYKINVEYIKMGTGLALYLTGCVVALTICLFIITTYIIQMALKADDQSFIKPFVIAMYLLWPFLIYTIIKSQSLKISFDTNTTGTMPVD